MKTYRSLCSKEFSLYIVAKGRLRAIKFIDGLYTTSNAAIIEALEKSKMFNKSYKLHEEISSTSVDVQNKVENINIKVYEDVTKVNEAAAILADEYGIDTKRITRKVDVFAFASELHISFPKLK